jgi:transposase
MARCFLTDEMWVKLAALLPPEKGETGRPYNAHRPWIEAILWKHRTGAPWRDLPEEFGSWKSIYCRFNRWSKAGVWQAVLEVLRGDADTEWLMIDSTVIRAHQHAAGAGKGGSRTRHSAGPEADCLRRCT